MTLDTRDRLLQAAAHQFARKGFDGASLRGIGDSVGIRAASIFHHFPGGKVELYETIFQEILTSVSTLVAQKVQDVGDSPAANIKSIAMTFWDFFGEHPDFAGLMLRESFDPEGANIESVDLQAEEVLALARVYIRSKQDAGLLPPFDPDALALFTALSTVTFHGAPGIANNIVPHAAQSSWARTAFEQLLDQFLSGAVSIPKP